MWEDPRNSLIKGAVTDVWHPGSGLGDGVEFGVSPSFLKHPILAGQLNAALPQRGSSQNVCLIEVCDGPDV